MGISRKIKKGTQASNVGKAVVLFKTVKEGILAEKVLLKNGFSVRKVAPPPEYRRGCEISLEIELPCKEEVTRILGEYGVEHQGVIPLS
jgi:hypothetical protein